jgi:hypothetical protein
MLTKLIAQPIGRVILKKEPVEEHTAEDTGKKGREQTGQRGGRLRIFKRFSGEFLINPFHMAR